MNSSSVRRIDKQVLTKWLTVYNNSRAVSPSFRAVTTNEIVQLLNRTHLELDDLLMAGNKSKALAIARVFSYNTAMLITDFSVTPDSNQSGRIVIEHILRQARLSEKQIVISWLKTRPAVLSDLLAEYTFEPRRIRLQMLCRVDQKQNYPLTGDFDISGSSENGTLSGSIFLDGRPLELFEVRDHLKNEWTTSISLTDGSTVCHALISNTSPHLGLLLIEQVVKRAPNTRLVGESLYHLFSEGVREVIAETDADIKFKRAFTENGFQTRTTLFEMVFHIMYTDE